MKRQLMFETPTYRNLRLWSGASGLVVLSLMAITTCDLFAQAATAVPDIQFEAKVYDFGEAQPNVTVNHTYRFKNVGQAPLKVLKVTSSCGCTATGLSKDELLPGEEGEISVALTVPSMRGATTKSVYVETNDPDEPRSVLSIKGKVVTEWVFDPSERITFGRVSSEEVQERRLKVYPHQNRALDITDVRVEAPDFDVSFDKVSDEPVWELVVKTKLSAGLGTKKGSVFLTTTSERVPEAEIGILAFVTGRIGVTPEQLVIRPRTAGNINGYLFVRSYENKPLNVTKAESTIAGAKLEMSPLSNGTIWRVMLSLEDPPERNPLSGVVTITTSDTNPRYSKFEIPVTIYPPLASQAAAIRPGVTRPSAASANVQSASQPVRIPLPPAGEQGSGTLPPLPPNSLDR